MSVNLNINNITNQTHNFSNSANNNQFNLGSQSLTIIADNALNGNTILSPDGISNSISGLTCSFDKITKLPLLETALVAVNQPPDNYSLSVNSTLYLTNTNPPTAPTKTITIDASNMIIDYESDTNQDLILQSSSSGSLKYIQTGVGATTKTLTLNPETILLQDPASLENIDKNSISNSQLLILNENGFGTPIYTEIKKEGINIQDDGGIINTITSTGVSSNNDFAISSAGSVTITGDNGITLDTSGNSITIGNGGADNIEVSAIDSVSLNTTTGDINLNAGGNIVLNNTTGLNNNLVLTNTDASPVETTTLSAKEVSYTDSFDTFTTSWLDIITKTNAGIPTLGDVLSSGSIATSDITLNNTGAGTNVISLLPNASASNPHITLTDGTTTNTIDKNGYTTRNSVQNATHYLNFSDNSSTGTGAIQKTSGISCNPSTNFITATKFIGDLSGNALTATNATTAGSSTTTSAISITDSTTTAGTFYPTFVNSDGSGKTLRIDTALSYSAVNNILTCPTFVGDLSGNATRATNIAGGLGGQIPYQTAVNTTALLANGTAGQVLTSNGTTLAPTWTTISAGSNASTINVTDTSTAGTYYPTFVSATGSTQTLRADTQYLRYNPSTNVLQNPSFMVSDGTEIDGNGGLVIAGAGSNTKTFKTGKSTLGTDQVEMEFQALMTGTTTSQMKLTSASSVTPGRFYLACFNKPSHYMSTEIDLQPDWTNVATTGIRIEQNYIVDGENALLTGFTTKNNLSSTYAYFEGTSEESRVDVGYTNVSIKSGVNPSPTEIVKINNDGLNVRNALNNYTFVATTLTLNFASVSYRNFYNATSITTAITQSAVSFSNAVAGGSYMVYITTGVGGSLTFNTGITNVKTTFSSNFTIPASSVAVMNIYYINSVYVIGINILT
jgi:hypothetical protein